MFRLWGAHREAMRRTGLMPALGRVGRGVGWGFGLASVVGIVVPLLGYQVPGGALAAVLVSVLVGLILGMADYIDFLNNNLPPTAPAEGTMQSMVEELSRSGLDVADKAEQLVGFIRRQVTELRGFAAIVDAAVERENEQAKLVEAELRRLLRPTRRDSRADLVTILAIAVGGAIYAAVMSASVMLGLASTALLLVVGMTMALRGY